MTEAPRIVPPDNRILFFDRDRESFAFLSHFFPAPFQLQGEAWASAEHFYQAQKSEDPAYRRAIRAADSPGQAKRLAASPDAPRRIAQRSWFHLHGRRPRPDWQDVKLDIMRGADWAKFSQNPDLAERLLATGTAVIVEDARNDAFWGIGRDGQGLNWAGQVLMEVRDRLSSRR